MVESIFFHLAHGKKTHVSTVHQQIVRAARQVGQPIFYSTAIIVVAFIPLFTMTGVPGKIFAPMSIAYGFSLVGALLMAFTLAPVLCSFFLRGTISEDDTAIVRGIRRGYNGILEWALDHRAVVVGACVGLLAITFVALKSIGGEFMPALEEGNLWVRATMPWIFPSTKRRN
jgi:cobalt-zinc-cadmium resistance protein CzcA